jgi:hypothetical protein
VRHHERLTALVLLIPWMSACSSGDASQLEKIAFQLSDAADRCVGDVRDHKLKYENSQNCRLLGKIAQQYISAGGFKPDAASRADRIAESARARAWMALAMSKTGDPGLSIW